jgi:molecular chaperone GrpE
MFEAPTPGKPSGIIIQIIEPGYVINERLLRPARVGVSKAVDGDTTLRVVDTEA